jgi:putative ABC transport system substrate-binding protein
MATLLRMALVGCLLTFASASLALTPGKPARIGWIVPGPASSGELYIGAFRAGLSALNYVEGRDFEMVVRSAAAMDQLPAIVEELPHLNLDLVVSVGAALYSLRDRITTTPIVYSFSGDPIIAGIADGLSRPLGNMTGVSLMSLELNEKRLELLKEIVPTVRKVMLTGNPLHPGAELEVKASQRMALQLGIEIEWHPVRDLRSTSC